ncbi:preprotein translocase subunit SecG [Candidatus Gillettellia adelgis]
MYEVLLIIFLLISIGLVTLITLQQGKGADTNASFGASASNIFLGSNGYGNGITRITTVLAMLFFIISLILSNRSSHQNQKNSEWDHLSHPRQSESATIPSALSVPPNKGIPQ